MRDLGDVVGVCLAEPRQGRRHVPVGVAGVAVQHVVRDRDHDRPVALAAQRVERAPEHLRAARGVVQRREVARDRPVGLLAADLRVLLRGDVVLAREQQDRAAIAVGLGDRGEGRLGARTVLRDAREDAVAVGGAGEAVGDVDRDALGARDDRPHARERGGVEQAVLGKADDVLGALALEQLDDPVRDERAGHLSGTYRVGDCSGRPAA